MVTLADSRRISEADKEMLRKVKAALAAALLLVPCSLGAFVLLSQWHVFYVGFAVVWIMVALVLLLGVHSFRLGWMYERHLAFAAGLLAVAASLGLAAFIVFCVAIGRAV